MSRTSQTFVRIPPRERCLAASVGRARLAALLDGPSFGEIVKRVSARAELGRQWRQRASSQKGCYRACITLVLPKSTVDSFHNSASGYRAQYYQDPSLGDGANRYALELLVPRIEKLVHGREKRTCPWWWVERSLLDPSSKVWIHQGSWLRQARHVDRCLRVERWSHHEASRIGER